MGGILKSIAAIYLAVGALGAAIIGTHSFLPISLLNLPPEWATPVILAVVTATLGISGGLFWLSDHVVAGLIGSPDRQHVVARPRQCYLCNADLLRDALTCPACGALVRDRAAPRQA